MASVWVARLQGKHGFEKLVAIKTILPKLSGDEMFQQMFLDEARISAGIEHTNVAQILDLGDDRGILYLVMEWVDGDSLSKLQGALQRKGASIPLGVSMRILADACGGLHAAHELRGKDGHSLGVVHRDVSPQNILVAANGSAKVIDFGIAKAQGRLAGETSAGLLKGKVQYMAPEQALGKPIDRRADVWAVGAIFYHLAGGQPPYSGPNQLATLHLLTAGRPPLPLPPSVPPPIQQVIAKALSIDPERRYETAAELQRALEQTMAQTGYATTTADVAAFTLEHLASRSKARREAVELALSAAAERARVEDLLQPTANDTRSSRISAKMLSQALGTSTRPEGVPVATAAAESPAPPSQQLLSENSSATIGPAGTMISAAGKSSTGLGGKRWGFAAGAVLAIAVGIGISFAGHLNGARPAAGASSNGQAAVSPVVASSAPPPDDNRAIASIPVSRPARVPPADAPGPQPQPSASASASEPSPAPTSTVGHPPKAGDGARAHSRVSPPAATVRSPPDPAASSPDKSSTSRHLDYGF
jgi:eukaryotic-like serine/threonine-protein kinase